MRGERFKLWLKAAQLSALIAVTIMTLPAARPDSMAASASTPLPGAPACPMLPADNILNTDISTMPLHPQSEAWKSNMNASTTDLRPDFGPSFGEISIPYGMPYEIVDSSRAKIPIDFYYASESDPGPYPLAPTTPIEGGHESGGDRHALMVDRDTCTLYETYDTHYVSPIDSWGGSGIAISLNSNALRPAGWTSADAAGLPILPLVLRRDEVLAGEVTHAIRFTAHATDRSYLWPATHQAGSANNPNLPPMGARFRLRADFDISGFRPDTQTALRAMKRYGLILADNGSDWYFGGTSEEGWDTDFLDELKSIPASVFDAIDSSSLMISPTSGQAKQPVTQPMCDERPASPISTGYLAEGSTNGPFDTWILVANPSDTQTVGACLTFFTGTGAVSGPAVTLPPATRRSVRVRDYVTNWNVSTIVDGITGTVVAERAMYASNGAVSGAHVGKAADSPGPLWFLPEGASLGGFETWILVANPHPSTASNIQLTYLTESGPVTGPSMSLGPYQRVSFRVNDRVQTYDVSTRVDADGPGVVAERATYVNNARLVGATTSPGTQAPGTNWYLAEGATAGGFETWILVANPDPTLTATVTLSYITGTGPVAGPTFDLGPAKRRSILVNSSVSTFNVSTQVSANRPVVAERALYSNHPILGRGASTGEGVNLPATEWMLAEGATAGGFETWILVMNPSAAPANVTLTYLTGAGPQGLAPFPLAPGQRRSIKVNDTVTTFDVATRVHSTQPVVVERSVYAPPGPYRDSTSGPGIAVY